MAKCWKVYQRVAELACMGTMRQLQFKLFIIVIGLIQITASVILGTIEYGVTYRLFIGVPWLIPTTPIAMAIYHLIKTRE